MIFQDFIHTVKDGVCDRLGADYNVSLQQFLRNNGVCYESLLIMQNGANISPMIYLNPYYHRYLNGMSISDICDDVCRVYHRKYPSFAMDTRFFLDYEAVRKRLVPKLINYDKNKELLVGTPHIRLLDLVMVFLYLFDTSAGSDAGNSGRAATHSDADCPADISESADANCPADIAESADTDCSADTAESTDTDDSGIKLTYNYASILIRDHHLKMWQINTERLYRDSLQNAPQLLPPEIKTMPELLEEFHARIYGKKESNTFGASGNTFDAFENTFETDSPNHAYDSYGLTDDDYVPMYVVTNTLRINGAVTVLYDDLLPNIARRLDCDLIVLPSSIHEMILVPIRDIPREELYEFQQMVQEVNATQVADAEILSNHAYYYDAAEDELSIL